MQLNPYLTFNGQCEAAFKFYEKCLGGKIEAMMTHGQSPMAQQVSPEWRNKIIHARMTVGGAVLMGSEAVRCRCRCRRPSGRCVSAWWSIDSAYRGWLTVSRLAPPRVTTEPLVRTDEATRRFCKG